MPHPLYLVEQGSRLGREGRRLIVTKEGETLSRVALVQVSIVIAFGNVQFTTPALQLLLDEGIDVVLLSRHGRFYGRLTGADSGHGALRVAQVLRARDTCFALATARRIVHGKVHNFKVFLQRYARRLGSPPIASAARAVDAMLARSARTTTLNSLMGVEGAATAAYFGVWKSLLQPPWNFEKRVRRPPTDPVNVLLSFGYTLLVQNILGAVQAAGMDPHVGFLHQLQYNRPSLALDLAEEFRPLVVDSVVLRCLNNQILHPEHFVAADDAERPLVLAEEGVRLFVRELETRLDQSFKHPVSGEQVTWRRLFHLQAYALARTLPLEQKESLYQPFLAR